MSIPPDDPAHRPPPPRQGEAPYPGGYQPPPPTGHWHGSGGSYTPPGQPPNTSPLGRRDGKSFFGALFDLNFDHMVTTHLIKVAYAIAIMVYSLVALLMLILAWSFFEWNTALGFITLIATPVVWTAGLLMTRMVLEFVINQFKITEHLKVLRERDGLR